MSQTPYSRLNVRDKAVADIEYYEKSILDIENLHDLPPEEYVQDRINHFQGRILRAQDRIDHYDREVSEGYARPATSRLGKTTP